MKKAITVAAIVVLCLGIFAIRQDSKLSALLVQEKSLVNLPPAAAQAEANQPATTAPTAPKPAPTQAKSLDPWTQKLKTTYTADRAKVNLTALEDFRAWMNTPQRNSQNGLTLAQARRESLNALARLNPSKAWDYFIPQPQRASLPLEVLAELETPVEAVGDWQPFAVCQSPDLNFSMFYVAVLNGAAEPEYALPASNLIKAGAQKQIPLHGYRLDGITVYDTDPEYVAALPGTYESGGGIVAEAPVESQTGTRDSLPFTSRPTDNINEGWRTAIYMRTEWTGWSNDQSEADAYAQWHAINNLLMSNSKGRYQILITVTPVIDMKTYATTYGYSPDISTYTDVYALKDAIQDVASQQYGYNMADYRHRIVYWKNGPGTFLGLASVAGNEIWLKSTANDVAYHELGHNMNYYHASFLRDQVAEDNYEGNIEQGDQEEYGHPFDLMGRVSVPGGAATFTEAHFCAAAARRWNWLHADEIYQFRDPGTFRIHAYDTDTLQHDRRYAIEIPRADGKEYYVSYYQVIAKAPNADAHRNGARLEVMDMPSSGGYQPLQPTLIDATYWSRYERQDSCIPIGMTFQDQEEGIFITPLARASDRSWMDVHVHQGNDPSNRAPVITSFTASTTTPGLNGNVNFNIVASDPDGDALAFHWYFDDDNWHRDSNTNSTSFSWSAANYRSVICTVTDMKGGVATGRILVTVGSPTTRYISGRVEDKWGNPVSSVPVDNGLPMTDSGNTLITGMRSTLTDVNGNYVLTDIADGSYSPATRVYGDTGDRLGGSNPVNVSGANVTNINFVIRVFDIVASATAIAEDGGTATFTIQRDPSYTAAVSVPERSIGKAVLGTDFTLTPAPNANGQYNLAGNQTSLVITVTSTPDTNTEGPEDITLSIEVNRAFSLVKPVQSTIWIDDAETTAPRVRLAPVGRVINENGGTEKIRATRFGSTNAALTLNLTTSGVGTYGTDYTILGGLTQVIPAGASTLDITLQGTNDTETEGRERIQIGLGNSSSYVKDPTQNSPALFIADDDIAVVSVAAIDNLAAEGDAANTARFRISRTGDLQDALYVEYNAIGTALHGTDYQALPGDLTIPIGQSNVDITITANADAFNDSGETVVLWLTSSETNYHLGTYNDVASIISGALPADLSPEPTVADLLYDTFQRYDNSDADGETNGMSGSLLPTLGVGATYNETWEGSGPDSIAIRSADLQLSYGLGMSENAVIHNFTNAEISAAGGFSVEIDIKEIITFTDPTDLGNRYAGFAVGLTQAEANNGSDINNTNSFRGRGSGPTVIGRADCFVGLNLNSAVEFWRYGSLIATVPVGATNGILTASFACSGFTTANTVTVNVFLDGKPVDINPGDPNSVSQTFNWQNNNANYIGLSCRARDYGNLDYFAIRKLPLYYSLFTQAAFKAGLSGTNASPTADADNDGEINLIEWVKGTSMTVSNEPATLITPVSATNGVFVFNQRRLANAAATGVQYPLYYSTNLTNWVQFTPVQLGVTPVSGNPSYEDAALQVPQAITTNQPSLFVRGTITQ